MRKLLKLFRNKLRRRWYDNASISVQSPQNLDLSSLTFDQKIRILYKDYWVFTDVEDFEKSIVNQVKDYTMAGPERIITLIRATKHIVEQSIKGDFVECGVWRGGSMMTVALTLMHLRCTDRRLFLYDTYEGMTRPTSKDTDHTGNFASETYNATFSQVDNRSDWCYAGLDDVKANLLSTGYPGEMVFFIKGKVEDTIPDKMPTEVSLLRLDTDWYESTYHEMTWLFPLLVKKGFLIVDDYGHWKGSKLAIDQYFKENHMDMFLNRVDYSARMGQKA